MSGSGVSVGSGVFVGGGVFVGKGVGVAAAQAAATVIQRLTRVRVKSFMVLF